MQTIRRCPCRVHETFQGSGTFLQANVATFTSGVTVRGMPKVSMPGNQAPGIFHAPGNNCLHTFNTKIVKHSKRPDNRSAGTGTPESVFLFYREVWRIDIECVEHVRFPGEQAAGQG